jgi:Xaa-Pro aminopeptidase
MLEQAVRLMDERGLAGLLIYSDGTCNILRASPLRYFAGVMPVGQGLVLVARGGRTVLFVEPAWDARRAGRRSWIEDVRGVNDLGGALVETLREAGIRGIVGLAGGRVMPYPLYAAISREVSLTSADDIVETMARRRTAEELALVWRVAEAADAGFEAFLAWSRPGVREYELVAEVEYAMRRAGADDTFILVSSGPHNQAMRAPTDRIIEAGDIVIGEITPVRDGQFVQLCRTVSVGPPSNALVAAYDLLLRAWAAALAEVRPGVPASIVATSMDAVLAEAGYGEYCRPPYMRTRGHGFGVGSVAPGATIDADTREPLAAGQVIVVHPNQYLPETGYLACGETFIVTPGGPERLSRTDTRLYGGLPPHHWGQSP